MSETVDTGAKRATRPAGEIRADIERERAELNKAFAALRSGLDEAVDQGRERADEVRRKARVVAPIVAGVVVSAAVARMLIRRRSEKED